MRVPFRWNLVLLLLLGGTGALIGAGLFGLADGRSGSSPEPPATLDLDFADAQGQTVRLADFRGKAVLLNVWATWCAPCRKEMPSLDRLQAAMGSTRFQVIALSVDRGGLDTVRPFFAEIGVKNLSIYLDPRSTIMKAAALIGLPTTILFDESGREIHRWVGPKEWDSQQAVKEIGDYLNAARALAPEKAWTP